MLIVAGAGTGKTKTLTAKIAKLIANGTPPWRILAMTFTNKAASEMRSRIEAMVPGSGAKVWMNTFHSFCVKILRQHTKMLNINPDFSIYGEAEQKKVINEVMKEMGLEKEKAKARIYLNLISRAKDDLLDAESYKIHAQASNLDYRITAANIYANYQKKLINCGALDFGDLLLKTATAFKEHAQIREYYQDYFKYVLVDEYQDTNHAQYVITKTLAAKHKNLSVVGDPDQSIYSWRGADIRNIMEFEHDFPDAKIITLKQNYRSTANILKAADNVIKYNINRKPKELTTVKSQGDPVIVQELANESQEARWVAQSIGMLINQEGYSLNEIAIFYRTNAQSRVFEDVFRRKQIPYRIVGSLKFYERAEVKDALCYLRLLVNSSDDVSVLRIINNPRRGIGKTAQEKIVNFAREKGISLFSALSEYDKMSLSVGVKKSIEDFCELFKSMQEKMQTESPSLILEKMLTLSGYLQSIQDSVEKDPQNLTRLNNLQELINAIKEYEARKQSESNAPTIADYLQEVALITADEVYDASEGAVTIMTVHLAKGLEFGAVFLTGLEEGLFPIGAGQASDDELEEERRLCYVGMTRAKKNLFMSYGATRRTFGRMHSNLPSRFLFESKLLESRHDDYEFERVEEAPQFIPAGSLHSGRRVRHSVYGTGRIISKSGSGEKTKIKVLFDKGGVQTFMMQYAPIEIL